MADEALTFCTPGIFRMTTDRRYTGIEHKVHTRVSTLHYDFNSKIGTLEIPRDFRTDMDGSIEVFTAIDPDVSHIVVLAGGQVDVEYVRSGSTWNVRNQRVVGH
jgi:hypothetical protein